MPESHSHVGRLLGACAVAVLLAACGGAPSKPPGAATGSEAAGKMISDVAEYAIWARQQPDEGLREELTRLEAMPETPDQVLHVALIVGQRQSGLYDPERTARLLARLAGQGPESSLHVQLAQVLLGLLPKEERYCGEAVCEEKLTLLVQMEDRRRKELTNRIDALRSELDNERAQRAKLEAQLEALRSLEEQIEKRDGPQTP